MGHDKSKYADCRFRVSPATCSALKDTYCDWERCNFYKPKSTDDEPEAMPKNRYNGLSKDKIAKIRDLYKSGMTQRNVAKAIGVSPMTVSKYVRGIVRRY